MRYLLPAAVITATALTSAAFAVDAKLYGTVNKALMMYDDGRGTDTAVVDNNSETTRFGIAAEKKLDNGLTASALFENQVSSNNSAAVTQNPAGTGNNGTSTTPASTSVSLQERVARVGLAGDWGAVFLGQQDVATDDAASHDLAAASSMVNANVATFGGGLLFKRKATNGTFSDLQVGGTDATIGTMALGLDGSTATADSIRYNSPVWNGLNGSASISQGGNVDATIRYAKDYAEVSVDSALGYTIVNDGTTAAANFQKSKTQGSVSAKLKNGLGATVSYVSKQYDRKSTGIDDASGMYGKVGYAWGNFGVAADYGHYESAVVNATDNEMDVYGVGGEWNLIDGVTAGAIYRNFNAKVAGVTNDQSIDLFALNMRVKF